MPLADASSMISVAASECASTKRRSAAINEMDASLRQLAEVTPVDGDDEEQTADGERGARDYLPGSGHLEHWDF